MTPRQTQPVPQIVLSPSDGKSFNPLKRSKAISRTQRQGSADSSDNMSDGNSRSPSPTGSSLRPRATTGLKQPLPSSPNRAAFFTPNPQRATQSSIDSSPGWVSQFSGRPEDVKMALTELIDEGGHINTKTVAARVKQIEEQNTAREKRKQFDLDKVADGSFGLTKVINPTSEDVTPEAAALRYQERQSARKSFFDELTQFAKDNETTQGR